MPQDLTMPVEGGLVNLRVGAIIEKDGKPTAQWEVQLVVTEDGYELLSW